MNSSLTFCRLARLASILVGLTTLGAASSKSDLTGFWTADDGATYYVLQDADNVVWWAGFSADGGRSFTNVYRGIWRPNTATEEPADVGTVDGEWADIPMGESMGQGTLRLSLRFSGALAKVSETGGFGASSWRKTTMDNVGKPPEAIKKAFPSQNDLTGIWSMSCGGGGTVYVRQVGNTVWWFGLNFQQGGPTFGEVYRATLQGNRIAGSVAILPWPWTSGSGVSVLNLSGDGGSGSRTLTVADSNKTGCTWRKVQ